MENVLLSDTNEVNDVLVSDIITVEKLLEIWGLKHLWPAFKEHNINLFCLDHMIESDIANLIPNVSDRIKFRFKLINYRKLNNQSENEVLSRSTTGSILNVSDGQIGTPSKKIKLSDESPSGSTSSMLNNSSK